MSDPLGIPVDIEKSELNSSLDAVILGVFGLGIYTMIYIGTMYIYFARSPSKRYIVPATITLLFLCNIVQTGVQWYVTKWQFVDNGDTRDSVFLSIFDGPLWVIWCLDISSYTVFVLADGLLIWRCFFIWNRSLRMILVPLLLIITEAALFFVQTVLQGVYGVAPLDANLAVRVNHLSFAAHFTTFVTSFLTTLFIAYRIYSASKQGASERKFRHIINIIVQSGAVYSLSLLVTAMAPVLPGGNDPLNTWSLALDSYLGALVNIIAGASTTILVARVSMLDTNTMFPSASIHLSGLQFHTRSTDQTDTSDGMEAGHSAGVDTNSVVEGLRVESKVE